MSAPAASLPRIVLAQDREAIDHFPGVVEAIRSLAGGAVRAERALTDEPLRLGRGDVLCVSDTRSFTARYALRRARAGGACCVLLMDGIVEYRNTFSNPRCGPDFLRPAPVDVVACCGESDAARLRELGNMAIPTGLPRLGALGCMPRAREPRALVATAMRPAFDDRERAALVRALLRIREALVEAHVPVEWRLTADLDASLAAAGERDARGAADGGTGVSPVRAQLTGSLSDALARASFVITSPSTLLVESMLAGRPTAMLFPFEAPRWPRAPLTIDQEILADAAALRAAIDELAGPGAAFHARQRDALCEMCQRQRPPAEALADLLIDLTRRPRFAALDLPALDPRRLPPRVPRRTGKTRIVSLVRIEDTPVGGVTVWSRRLARELARRNSRFDMRTLLVVAHPDSLPERFIDDDGLTHTCVLDPMSDRWEALETLRAAIDRLQPDIICPNYADICFAAATLARAGGARIVPIAHTDHDSYRDLIGFYDRWDAAAGVSDACMAWLAPLAREASPRKFSPQRRRGHRGGSGLGEELGRGACGSSAPRDCGGTRLCLRNGGGIARPVRKIVYGVPVAQAPREMARCGPLRIAYIGRMVEAQKRISDLLEVIDGLEQRGVQGGYELYMIGDGADLPRWHAGLAQRSLRHGRVIIHGRLSPDAVQRLLPSIDVSILVSEYEGTSITMLEAMGAGVVPAVTRVHSGVTEWVRDGENGIVVEIGDTEAMADRLSALARDRALLARLGAAAWRSVRADISIARMADEYESLFEAAMARPRDLRPTDTGLRLIEPWHKNWCDEPDMAGAWIRSAMDSQGFSRIAEANEITGATIGEGGADPAFDAAILSDDDDRARSLRAGGVGVALSPALRQCDLLRAVRAAAAGGATRIAIYGLGLHTRRCAGIFLEGLPIVGIIDDHPPPWETAFGLPVTTAARALRDLRPDAIVLSRTRFEREMWEKTAPLRAAGVRVITLDGSHDQTSASPEPVTA